jgi:hypothetical protein
MAQLTYIKRRDLTSRRSITLDLPEFLLCALEHRVQEANAPSELGEPVTIEHVVELELAESVSLAEVALLESKIPGISAAVSEWLAEID